MRSLNKRSTWMVTTFYKKHYLQFRRVIWTRRWPFFSINADRGKTGSSNIFQHWKKKMGDTFQIPRMPLPHRRQVGHRARGEKNLEILAEIFNQEVERTNSFFFLKSTTLKNDLRKNSLSDFSFFFYKFQLQSVCCFCCCYFVCFETLEAEAQQFF